MKLLLIFASLIFLLYLYYNPKMQTKETFDSNNTVTSGKIFKENHDLNYMNKRTGNNVDKITNVNTQRVAPINIPNIGKSSKGLLSSATPFPSTRVPDKKSNKNEYKIPLPDFDNRLETNIVLKTDSLNKKQKIVTSKINRPKKAKKKIQKPKSFGKACKFITSFEKKNFSCPKEFPVFTGATFGVKGSEVSCNGDKTKIHPAKALAIIKNGSLKSIKILDKGENYDVAPKIKIKGDGTNAKAYAIVEKGEISKIIVTNPGSDYTSTPKIKIENPKASVNCNLCCRSEL